MSARTAAAHKPTELRYVCLDEAGEIAYFESASQSNPGATNVTAYDIDEDTAYCFCKGFEVRGDCWHVAHAAAAWRLVAHREYCRRMDIVALVAYGQTLVGHIMQADAAGQVWIAGRMREQLDDARIVWREKRAATSAARATVLPTLDQAGITVRVAA